MDTTRGGRKSRGRIERQRWTRAFLVVIMPLMTCVCVSSIRQQPASHLSGSPRSLRHGLPGSQGAHYDIH